MLSFGRASTLSMKPGPAGPKPIMARYNMHTTYTNETTFLQDATPIFNNWLTTAFANPKLITSNNQLPEAYGYYAILSNMPVPAGARMHKDATDVMVNELYLWRDGVGTIGLAIDSTHLFRNKTSRRNGQHANSMKITTAPVGCFTNQSHNYKACPGGLSAWENGMNILEDRWEGYDFYVAYVVCDVLASTLKQTANTSIGFAPLNLQWKK